MRPDQAEDEKLRTPADARDHYQASEREALGPSDGTVCSASSVRVWRVSYDPNYGEYFVVEGNKEVRKTRANAELHAAAPKMLAALQSLIGVIDSHDIQTEDCDRRGHLYCDCLQRAREPALDAIREALGQNAGVLAQPNGPSESKKDVPGG